VNRRQWIRIFAVLPLAGSAVLFAGCRGEKEKAQTPPATPPAPEPTPTEIVAEETPQPEETPVAEATPEIPAEPAAPYGELTSRQQERLDQVMSQLSEVNADEAKRWMDNLAYDAKGAERELRTWEAIARAYTLWNDERPGINDAAKQEAFGVLVMASLMPAPDALRYVHLSALTKEDAKAAIDLYTPPTEPSDTPSPTGEM
jgi:hypothetical protein